MNKTALEAAPRAWKLVPARHDGRAGLTPEMFDAFWKAFSLAYGKHGNYESVNAGYNAMLDAAPVPTDPVNFAGRSPAPAPAETEEDRALANFDKIADSFFASNDAMLSAPAEGVTDELAGNIAYALTRRLVIDMPTARAAVDEAMSSAALLPSAAEKAGVVGCHGLDTPERVCFYEQDFYVLSNFSSFMIAWDDKVFPTSEHVYHWEKFNTRRSDIAAEIRVAISAHEAFKIAERNKHLRRRNWDDVKVDIMRDILRAKAAQHEYVRRKLLATGNRELVENSWRDDFWGWGPNRGGKNMLGKLWMEVRAELRASPSPATGEA